MMPSNRFSFGDDDGRLLERADSVEIKLYKFEGRIEGSFKISGSLGCYDDEDDGGAATANDVRLARELLERFQSQHGGSAL
jgi:hypothetical protein